MDTIVPVVKEFVLTRFLPGEDPNRLTGSTELIRSGILDSLATLSLISFLEEQFKIELEAHETDIDNFDRIEDIAALVERKQAR